MKNLSQYFQILKNFKLLSRNRGSLLLVMVLFNFSIDSYCSKQFVIKGIYMPVVIMESNYKEKFPATYIYRLNINRVEDLWVKKNIKVNLFVPSKASAVVQHPDTLKRNWNDIHEEEEFYKMLLQYYYPLLNESIISPSISCVFFAEFLVEKNDHPIDPEFIRISRKQSKYIYKNRSYKILKCLNFRPMVLLDVPR